MGQKPLKFLPTLTTVKLFFILNVTSIFQQQKNKLSVNKHQTIVMTQLRDNDAHKALGSAVLTWTTVVENRELSVLRFAGLRISLKLGRFWAHL